VLFAPRSIAILGVSRQPGKLGHRLLENVLEGGYAGAVHPVNPSGEPILGHRTVKSIDALPDGIDLALVSLPAPAVPDAIRGLAERRVRAAVVLSSGFGEVDAEGRNTQASLLAMARSAGLRLVGPNCMGVYSAPARLNGTYFWDLPRVEAGPRHAGGAPGSARGGIGVVSQSGAYGGLIFRHLGSRGLGVGRFLSIGNQADVEIAEVIEYLAADPVTSLIACFIEALDDGARFLTAARCALGRKPLVVLKGGRSEAGRRAAGSHTGSLAGSYEVFREACRSVRAVLAEETEEFFDAIETLAIAGDRRPGAPRVAIVTVSGGPSVVAADVAEREGLAVPALDPETRVALRALLPPFAAVGNPVDLTPQVEPARIAAAVGRVVAHPDVAGAVAVNVGLDIPEFADGVVAAAGATGKPVVAFIADAPEVTARLKAGGVPVLPSPERAVRAWRALWLAQPSMPAPIVRSRTLPGDVAAAIQTGQGPLPYALARRMLEEYGVRFCHERTAVGVEETVAAAEAIGYPVVVKVDAPGMLHKTEAGGVALDLRDAHAVREACTAMAARTGASRFVVQERVGPGVELLVGGRRDDVFGPVVAVGTGGILTEVVRDVSLRLAPIRAGEAREMLREGLRVRLLAGPRGLPPVEDAALVAALEGLSALLVDQPRILEVDVNPLIAAGAHAVAVDAVVIVGPAT
jgi:acyl-CoA synthetase (NDP forming)